MAKTMVVTKISSDNRIPLTKCSVFVETLGTEAPRPVYTLPCKSSFIKNPATLARTAFLLFGVCGA